jgi:chromosome partitioning protein
MQIIAIANQKGGCGKTTTAINLGAALTVNKKNVLLIDLDPQGHASSGLNCNGDLTIYDVLSKLTKNKAKLSEIIKPVHQGLSIAPSSIVLSTLEQELADEIGRESSLFDVLKDVTGYDYIIIDCPPNLGILTVNALRAANSVIIPVEPSRFAIEGVHQLSSIIKLINERLKHNLDYTVLVTIFDSRLRHSFRTLNEMKKTFENKMFETIIHINVSLKESQAYGSDIFGFDKYSRGAKDYYSLAREIITNEMPLELKAQEERIIEAETAKMNTVVFSLLAPDAKEVFLVGEFNNWAKDENSRLENINGLWAKDLNLKKGSFRYKFVVDGNWIADPDNPSQVKNPYGEMDSIIKVK